MTGREFGRVFDEIAWNLDCRARWDMLNSEVLRSFLAYGLCKVAVSGVEVEGGE